jgi:acetyl/propionyl-CoA carboxylase alpha subunit
MEVGIYYDPMLAKLVAHGPDRETARRKLVYALKNLSVQGIQTNREFLIRLLEHPEFRRERAHTGFIAEHFGELVNEKDAAQDFVATTVVALYLRQSRQAEARILPRISPGFRNNPYRDPSVRLQIGGEVFEIAYRVIGDEMYTVTCGDWQAQVEIVSFEPGGIRLAFDGVQRRFQITQADDQFYVHSSLGSRAVALLPRYPQPRAAAAHETANAPMPGHVLRILVSEGQQVAIGDALVILEAMKMEQTIKAAMDGMIEAILVKPGEVVAPGDVLIQIATS